MIKEQLYSEKFAHLEPWVESIFTSVKKDLRNEHLRKNPQFVNKYFSKRPLNKITSSELQDAYYKEILEGNEEIGEWVVARWMFKNAEIYQFFAVNLSKINPDFEQIEEIPEDKALVLMRQAVAQFGAVATYVFSVFNAVSFPAGIFQALRDEAVQAVPSAEVAEEALSLEDLKAKYEREIAKLTDKFEQKMQGMQRKYTDDVQGFKKQIAQLQRRLQDAGR